jgi:DMSO/TMAO reductase YedYZ heme-binding membrane subunit
MTGRGLSGPRLVVAAAAGVLALVGAILATPHPGESELRVTLRVTALVSATFFLAAFTASAWQRLRPTPTTRWLLQNRRYLGLSFAASHLAHGLTILALARRLPGGWAAFPAPTLAGGGAGYAFIAAMAATSNDRAVAALGRWWHRLHTTGVYVLWFIFTFTYAGAAAVSPYHALLTTAFVAALGLRLAARFGARRAMPAALAAMLLVPHVWEHADLYAAAMVAVGTR